MKQQSFRALVSIHGAVGLGLLAAPAFSQTINWTITGNSPDRLAESIDTIGDIDSDGRDDAIVGAPLATVGMTSHAGRVQFVAVGLMGATQGVSLPNPNPVTGDGFGQEVCRTGDIDGDGVDDFVVGVPGLDTSGVGTNDGAVFAYSTAAVLLNPNSAPLWTFTAAHADGAIGFSIALGDDVDGDGTADLYVGAPGIKYPSFSANTSLGRIHILSGKFGSLIRTIDGESIDDGFGIAVSALDDLDSDGAGEVLVGAYEWDGPGGQANGVGRTYVFDPGSGQLIQRVTGTQQNSFFGRSVEGLMDVDGDGTIDYAVGAPVETTAGGSQAGAVRVISGSTGLPISTVTGTNLELLGWSLAEVADRDHDGIRELAIGGPRYNLPGGVGTSAEGRVLVIEPKSGATSYQQAGATTTTRLGFTLARYFDVNADGAEDILVGGGLVDNPALTGTLHLLVGATPPPLGVNFCTAVANSSGTSATMQAFGNPVVPDGLVTLSAVGMPPSQVGFFIVGDARTAVLTAGGGQGTLCIAGTVGRYNSNILSTGPDGQFAMGIDVNAPLPTNPPTMILTGSIWNFQAYFRDNNPAPTSNYTDGLAVTFM